MDAAPTMRPPVPCLMSWIAAYLYEKKTPLKLMSSSLSTSAVGADIDRTNERAEVAVRVL